LTIDWNHTQAHVDLVSIDDALDAPAAVDAIKSNCRIAILWWLTVAETKGVKRLSRQTVIAKDFIDAPALEVGLNRSKRRLFRFGSTAGGAVQLITAVHKRRRTMVGPTTGKLRRLFNVRRDSGTYAFGPVSLRNVVVTYDIHMSLLIRHPPT